MPRLLAYLGIMTITIFIIWLLVWTKPQPEAKLETLIPLKVAVTEVETREVRPEERVTGRLQPINVAHLHFEVEGKVISREVEPGMRVAKEQVLITLEKDDYQNQLLLFYYVHQHLVNQQ